MSPAEIALWQILRTRPAGLKFRHQHPAGPFVLDFYCAAKKLVIEVDGVAHEMGDNPKRDERRGNWLRAKGYRILRMPATEVLGNLEGVLSHILIACAVWPLHHPSGGPPPHPLRGQGG